MPALNISDGTSQEERALAALRDGYFYVDEMRFEDLLAMASRFAALVQYRNASNRPDGNWERLFRSDEVSILASILVVDLPRLRTAQALLTKNWRATLGDLRRGALAPDSLPAYHLAELLNEWFIRLDGCPSVAATRTREAIGELIEKSLRRPLAIISALLRSATPKLADSALERFDPFWLTSGETEAGQAESAPGSTVEHALNDTLEPFHNAVKFLQEQVPELLHLSLGRHDHDPSMGLLIAFLRLFVKAKARLNRFTQDHLAFYYRDVLQVPRRGYVPDSTFLIFSNDVAGRKIFIPKGTEFKGGMDGNGVERLYIADSDLLVTDAKVAALHTVYLGRNVLSSPENALVTSPEAAVDGRQYVTEIRHNVVARPGKDGHAVPVTPEAQPLFGHSSQRTVKGCGDNGRIGFAVSSSVLLLKEGRRDLTVTIRLAEAEPEAALDTFVSKLSQVLATTRADAFFKAFRRMFLISLTGESGWLEIDEYLPLAHVVDPLCEPGSLKIQFRLPENVEGVIPYDSKLHGGGFGTDLPVIRFTVNPAAYLYPYSLLSETHIREVEIEATVAGFTDVLVYNQFGQLNPTVQFTPFGPTPVPGDYLVVGCYEAAHKRLTSFELDVEWTGLPTACRGFGEYYRAYPMTFANDIFKVELAVLRDRKWVPEKDSDRPQRELFDSVGEEDSDGHRSVSRDKRFSFAGITGLLRPLDSSTEQRFGYDTMAKDGFFRLMITKPDYGFGHREYTFVLSNVLTENARLKKIGLKKLLGVALPERPLPNPPYMPTIQSITVNYSAVTKINLERISSAEEEALKERIYHLLPMGLQALSPASHGRTTLVPQFDADGNLLIGLSGTALAGMLTLFFHLREDSSRDASADDIVFRWYYLASNRWIPLAPHRVISDSTMGFLSSGIVTLDIPEDIDRNSTVLPNDLFWLRVSADGEQLDGLCSLYGVSTQATRVTWRPREGNSHEHLAAGIPAETIKAPRFSIAGISGIRQIIDSFGGRSAERKEQWTIRTSERLKHRGRAVTPWDYERLVLQQFPEVYKVKCFPCMDGAREDSETSKAGHLLIVVIPGLTQPGTANLRPTANALILREVNEYVASLSSAFVDVHVRNPAYEPVQVRCKVKFRRGVDQGLAMNRLNRAIFDYLSPWNDIGQDVRFGWSIRCNEVQSYIFDLDFIESVSGLSLLHICEIAPNQYRIDDTARENSDVVTPGFPWSIAVPFEHHLIEVESENDVWPPKPTGISEVAIGRSFILTREKA